MFGLVQIESIYRRQNECIPKLTFCPVFHNVYRRFLCQGCKKPGLSGIWLTKSSPAVSDYSYSQVQKVLVKLAAIVVDLTYESLNGLVSL